MLVLALDTTTRQGSVALARDGVLIDAFAGDPAVTHGRRLPADLMHLLDRHHLHVGDIDLFAVAAGPGSFTGLRIGIATMQGLALANAKQIVGISALDALHHAHLAALRPPPSALTREAGASELAVWLDAQRDEVFSALYQDGVVTDGPSAEKPADILRRWVSRSPTFVGAGALAYGDLIRAALPASVIVPEVPLLAPSIALLAGRQEGQAPDALRALYVRRPDVELARDRKAGR